MAYTLITANRNYSSWSLRPWILMKVLDIPFEDRLEPFTQASNREAFRKFSPTGQVPVLMDGHTAIWDSLAIVMYLAERHKGVWPEKAPARAFAQSAVAEMHSGFPALRTQCPMNVGVRVRLSGVDGALASDLDRITEIFAGALKMFRGPFLGGTHFSALDAFYAPVAYRVRTFGLDVGRGQAWVDHVLALPAMREWEAQALAESWRQPLHEQETGAAGTIVEDRRHG